MLPHHNQKYRSFQVAAFTSSWGVLFLLSAVENRFLQSSVLANERTINIQMRTKLLSAVSQLEQLRLDSTEYSQLRLLSLIKGIFAEKKSNGKRNGKLWGSKVKMKFQRFSCSIFNSFLKSL